MFEKVNPGHPDKVADRIAGAIVDLAYQKEENPKIAVEVLIGHGTCTTIVETSAEICQGEVEEIIHRIGSAYHTVVKIVPQDKYLAGNQKEKLRCGDNGIFKGMPITAEQKCLSTIAREIYDAHPFDGKYVLNNSEGTLILCQSNVDSERLREIYRTAIVNPLGDWTGGTDVDTGATNRKLGSDMGDAVTGGGLHGKDLSKADVSVNIYAHLKAQETGEKVELFCAIGDDMIDGKPYSEIVEIARNYINSLGGFEKLAEWGLI